MSSAAQPPQGPSIGGTVPLPQGKPKVYRRRFASLRTITALILREMSSTYGRSPGGYIWVVLEPVAGIFLLSLVFSMFLATPGLGVSFPLFYATGVIPFTAFLSISGAVAQSLNFSRQLLAYPAVTWVDALLARFTLNYLTEIMVAYIVLFGIITLFETRVIVNVPDVALSLLMLGALALGVGCMNCFLFTFAQVWQRVWSIMMRPMFLISGVMFLFNNIPQPWRDILWFNPLVHIVGMMRRGFYTNYDAHYVSPVYVFLLSGVLLVTGLVFLSRYHRDLLTL